MNIDRGQRPVPFGAELHPRRHLMPRGRADELFFAGQLPFHRPAGLEGGEQAEVFGNHLLLSAEPPADALGEDMQVADAQTEDMAELLLHDEGCLRTGADVQPSVVAAPGDRSVRFQMDVLDARGGIGHFVHGVGGLEAIRYAADLTVDVDKDIALLLPTLVVKYRCIRVHRRDRIEHRGQDFVGDVEQAAGLLPPRPRFPPRRRRSAGPRNAPHCRGHRYRPGSTKWSSWRAVL